MAFAELHYWNPALGKQTSCSVILPQNGDEPFPVFYLLHGLSDDHSMWMRRSSIERHVESLPLIVVMPDGGKSFYCDEPDGDAYETAIARELVSFIDSRFRTCAERRGRVIAGLSMGGYGALKLALQYPDVYCAAVSHSGAVQWGHAQPQANDEQAQWYQRALNRSVGPNPQGNRNDLYALAEAANRETLPALRLDCGTEDFLIEHNRDYHAHLEQLGVPHEYAEFPGAHDWSYWDTHVQETIAFFRPHLGI